MLSPTEGFDKIMTLLKEERARPLEPKHLVDSYKLTAKLNLTSGMLIGELKNVIREAPT